MVRLEVRITQLRRDSNCSCWCNWNVSVPTTADTIDEWTNFSIAMELFRLRVQLSTITMRLWQRSLLLRLPKDLMCIRLYIEQPFCSRYFVYFCSNKWYGWKCDYTTTDVIVTVPAGATTGTVSVTTADTIDEVDETFSIANGTVSATGTISTITMRLLWQRSLLLRLPKDLMWYSTLH
jgi:hypothetical protein